MPNPSDDYWNTETKRYHGSASRPPALARQCGNVHRYRYIRKLRNVAHHSFGMLQFFAAYEGWKKARTAQTKSKNALSWSAQQVRPEVAVTIGLLQDRHLENTGKEVSRAEVINALVAAGLPELLQNTSEFR